MSLEEEVLKHQYIYVPWVTAKPIYDVAAPLALHLRGHHNARLTVACPVKSNAPDALARFPIVTERSGNVSEGGIVLAYCPTYNLMAKISHLSKSIIVLVEWATESFEGWAKLVGAYNVATQSLMTAGLTAAGREALAGLVFEGYKGWHDGIAERASIRHLEALAQLGEYDRDVVLAYARNSRGEDGIKRLYGILERFEVSRPTASA